MTTTLPKPLTGFGRRAYLKVDCILTPLFYFFSPLAAASKSSRTASRGLVTVSVDGNRGSMIELNSETYAIDDRVLPLARMFVS